MRILAVVVTYNRVQLLRECIDALQAQLYNRFDILIVNNNSTDTTEEYCKSIVNDRIFYYNTGHNLGGAGGFSIGIKYALAHNYDWCWVMDDDTIAFNDSLSSLVNKISQSKNEMSFVASVVRWIDGSTCIMNRQAISTDWLGKNEELGNHLIKVTFSSFVSTMINLKYARIVGLPIAEMFIYGDDLEYTVRLSKIAQGYVDLDSAVIHKMGSNVSTDILNSPADRIDRFYYNYRNRIYIDRKQRKATKNIINCMKQIVKIVLSKGIPQKRKRIQVICKGIADGLQFKPTIIQEYNWED